MKKNLPQALLQRSTRSMFSTERTPGVEFTIRSALNFSTSEATTPDSRTRLPRTMVSTRRTPSCAKTRPL